jgi:hypothetical protein
VVVGGGGGEGAMPAPPAPIEGAGGGGGGKPAPGVGAGEAPAAGVGAAGAGALEGRVMAFTGQFLTHISHITHFSGLVGTAFLFTRSKTPVGQTRTQLPQPVHKPRSTVTCETSGVVIRTPLSVTGRKALETRVWGWE